MQKLWGRLIGRQQPKPEEAFLEDLVVRKRSWDAERTAAWASGKNADPLGVLLGAGNSGEEPPAWASEWFEAQQAPLADKYPDADTYAYHWLCSVRERKARVRELGQQGLGYGLDPVLFLLQWCLRTPAPDQAEAVEQAAREALENWNHQVTGSDRLVAAGLLRLLVRLGAIAPAAEMLMEAVRALAEARAVGASCAREKALGELVGSVCLQPVLEAGVLSADDADLLLREFPHYAGEVQGGQADVITRYVERAAAGESDPQVIEVLLAHPLYEGIAAFMAAARELERFSGTRMPAGGAPASDHPLAWALHVLRHMAPPSPADAARAPELGTLQPDTLLKAALLAPEWAGLAEPHLDWPGLQEAARWLEAASAPVDPEVEDLLPTDRQGALAAVSRMGTQRAERLLNTPAVRAIYREGVLCLGAILGRNADAVETGLLSRSLPAVRALGLLPDKGDIAARYAALRRFMKESRRGRSEAERRAADQGLANLAVTAGHTSVSRLEWALEGQLSDEARAARKWNLGAYTVRLEPTEAASLIVERNGKRMRNVPAAVKKSSAYGEIKAAQEATRSLWWRIRRRLEQAMACEERLGRETFLPTFRTGPGTAMIPRLVLRVWLAREERPVEVLGFRTLDGRAVALEQIEQLQIAHPLRLTESGTLQAWQEHLVAGELTQPFNQLFREIYLRSPAEEEHVHRFAGRQVKPAVLTEQLRRTGWRRAAGDLLSRRFSLEGGPAVRLPLAISSDDEPQTLGAAEVFPELPPVLFSEALRELERAVAEAAADPESRTASPEVVAMRAALIRTLLPSATIDGDEAGAGAHRVDLRTGAPSPEAGQLSGVDLLPTAPIPFPDADALTVRILSLLDHLSRAAV
jgi:hypothetical protein